MKIPNKKEKHPKTIPIHTSTIHHPFKLDQKKVKSPIGQGQADVQKAPQRGRARPEKIRTFFWRYGSGDHTKKSPMKRCHISTVFAKKTLIQWELKMNDIKIHVKNLQNSHDSQGQLVDFWHLSLSLEQRSPNSKP